MRPVYAVQFETRPPESATGTKPIDAVKEAARAWVQSWYTARKGLTITMPNDGNAVEPMDLHRIEVSAGTATTGESIWSLVWSYPADSDDDLLWQSTVTIAHAGGCPEVSVVIRIASRDFRIAPLRFDVRRPHIVKTLIQAFPCYLGGRQLRTTMQSVGAEDIGDFQTYLFDPSRPLPIVLFSRDPYSGHCLASPSRVADILTGLADVHVLNDKWAGFKLTNAVGSMLSCFNGAVRIYWPGFSQDASPALHKLFMPDEVHELDSQFPEHLMRRIAPISALRLTDLSAAKKVRAAFEADRVRDSARVSEQLKAGAAAREEVEAEFFKLIEEREVAITSRRAAEEERDDAQLRLLELEDEIRQLKDNLKAISANQSAGGEPPPSPADHPEFGTVRAALDLAAKDFAEQLVIWGSAERSADKSSFGRPREVYQALMAISELAAAHFKNKANDGPTVGPWEVWFEEKGFGYAAKESQNTINMYGSERDFSHKGERRRMQRHLTLGGGDRTNCLQIYFDIDDTNKKFLIGYCGMHLLYCGMRT